MRHIIKNASYLIFARFVSLFLRIIFVGIISRVYGVKGFGMFAFVVLTTEFMNYFIDLGQMDYCIREISRDKSIGKKLISNLLSLKIFFGIIVYILTLIIVKYSVTNSSLFLYISIMGFGSILYSLKSATYVVFRSYKVMKYESYLMIVEEVMFILVGSIFALNGFDIIAIFFIYIIISVFTLIISLILVTKRFFHVNLMFNQNIIKKVIKKSIPFFLSENVNTTILRTSAVFIMIYFGAIKVGLFMAALNIVLRFEVIPYFISTALYPYLSSMFNSSKEYLINTYKNIFKIFIGINFVLFFIIIIFAKWIILLIYGYAFEDSVIILQLLVIAAFFFYMDFINRKFLNSIGKQILNMWLELILLLMSIMMGVLLVPKMNFYGAIISVTVPLILGYFIKLYHINKYIKKFQ